MNEVEKTGDIAGRWVGWISQTKVKCIIIDVSPRDTDIAWFIVTGQI